MEILYAPPKDEGTTEDRTIKKCIYCAEQIQYEAIKCRHCHEYLDSPRSSASNKKWFQSTPALAVALLAVGPLALPLVWINPRYSKPAKAAITAGMLAITVGLYCAAFYLFSSTFNQLKELGL